MAIEQMYAAFSASSEQYFAKMGKSFASNMRTDQMPVAGGPVMLIENPANSNQDLSLARIVISTSHICEWFRKRSVVVSYPANGRGAVLPAVNRGGNKENIPIVKTYSMVGKSAAIKTGFEKSVFIPEKYPYNIVEDGNIILKPGENLIWGAYPVEVLKDPFIINFELVWWESPTV
jgi:hypothetical protein